jgi:hypothetical protein
MQQITITLKGNTNHGKKYDALADIAQMIDASCFTDLDIEQVQFGDQSVINPKKETAGDIMVFGLKMSTESPTKPLAEFILAAQEGGEQWDSMRSFINSIQEGFQVRDLHFRFVPKETQVFGKVYFFATTDDQQLLPTGCTEIIDGFDALEIYANTPNPASQIVYGATPQILLSNAVQLMRNVEDPVWLKELFETL